MDYYQDIWHMWILFIYPLYPESSIPRCMISSDTPLYYIIFPYRWLYFDDIPIYGSVSKPCTPGEHQNSWWMDVHSPKNGINRYWSIPISPYCWWMLMVCICLYPMIIFHGMTIPGATRPVPPVLSLAKSLRPRFPGPAIGPENLWGSSPGKNMRKTPKNPLNPPLFPLKIGQKRGGGGGEISISRQTQWVSHNFVR